MIRQIFVSPRLHGREGDSPSSIGEQFIACLLPVVYKRRATSAPCQAPNTEPRSSGAARLAGAPRPPIQRPRLSFVRTTIRLLRPSWTQCSSAGTPTGANGWSCRRYPGACVGHLGFCGQVRPSSGLPGREQRHPSPSLWPTPYHKPSVPDFSRQWPSAASPNQNPLSLLGIPAVISRSREHQTSSIRAHLLTRCRRWIPPNHCDIHKPLSWLCLRRPPPSRPDDSRLTGANAGRDTLEAHIGPGTANRRPHLASPMGKTSVSRLMKGCYRKSVRRPPLPTPPDNAYSSRTGTGLAYR